MGVNKGPMAMGSVNPMGGGFAPSGGFNGGFGQNKSFNAGFVPSHGFGGGFAPVGGTNAFQSVGAFQPGQQNFS